MAYSIGDYEFKLEEFFPQYIFDMITDVRVNSGDIVKEEAEARERRCNIAGKDGKLRYPKPLRLRLFQRVFGDLKKAGGGEIPVYFCMESRDIWMDVQKKTPRSKKEVEKLLTLPLGANDF